MTADPALLDSSAPAAARVRSSASASTITVTTDAAGFPHGHRSHLSASQAQALEQFKAALQREGLWKRGPPPSHDDQTLLRYLRARRWVAEDALAQFRDTEAWRAANSLDVLYATIELEAYEQSRRLYPQWTGRRDRRGIPLYVFEVRPLDSKTIANYERLGAKAAFSQAHTDGHTPPGLLRLFALYENLTRFSHPFCTNLVADREHADVPVTMSTNIVDISGVGLKQFWNLKGHMQVASQLATAHYPETLDRIFIIGAPAFFSTVWGWVKRWFDPITVSKIFVLAPHEVLPTLEAFIDPRNIPRKYGGQLDYEFGHLGVADPAWEGVVRWEKGFETFPSGPLLWEDDEAEEREERRMVCVQLGAVEGKTQRKVICSMPKTWNPPEETVVDVSEGTRAAGDSESRDEVVEAVQRLKIDYDEKHGETNTSSVPAAASIVA